jgi:hypothetical protein
MGRALPALAVALFVALSSSFAAAQDAPKRKAYRARDNQRAAAAEEAQPAQSTGKVGESAPGAGLEAELEAAREKRDRQLEEATANETDRRALEKKKTEIFAQYAAIVAGLRDKYYEQHPEEAPKPQAGSKRPKASKRPPAPTEDPAPAPRKARKSRGDEAGSLAEAEQQLADENARHAAKLESLNAQLKDAESSGNNRKIRAARKLVEKENNSYNARREILERRVKDLGGSIASPPPADSTSEKR